LVKATRRRGQRIWRLGIRAGVGCPRGVVRMEKALPPRKAKRDWMVRRKTGNLKRSGAVAGP
jgi:hypothetical protein